MNTVIIKNKLDADSPKTPQENHKYAQNSFQTGYKGYYNTKKNDWETLEKDTELQGEKFYILLVSYNGEGKLDTENVANTELVDIYVGEASLIRSEEDTHYNIEYNMKKKITKKEVMINLLDGIGMNLQDDYKAGSYLTVRKVSSLAGAVRDLLTVPEVGQIRSDYEKGEEEYVLAPHAQHNEMCRRVYGSTQTDKLRNEFQRDRERIVNSKAFRRLVDKAQVFSAEKGDHYRTRMTHTLEVNQIAKAISAALHLNLDLTEAIALGHDLGHTPFGHQGERTLRDILYNKECEGLFCIEAAGFEYKSELGGFKHNYQGIRVLTKLEEKYVSHVGLDISFQALEGILKHTKLKDAEIADFISEEYVKELHIDKPFCTNLEGQVVWIADEIAQRGHDIDDAITSGLIDVEELLESLGAYKFQDLHDRIERERDAIAENKRHYINERDLMIGRIISCIVGYFINDVIEESKKKVQAYVKDYSKGIFDERLICFSKNAETCCAFLENLVNKRVIADSEVAKFDYNANVIIKKLFESYYKNPKLLHSGTLRKIYVDSLLNNNIGADSAIDLLNGNIDIVRQEIKKITTTLITDLADDEQKVLFEKRKILIRNIVDYIAGMTDSYAMKEYHKIY